MTQYEFIQKRIQEQKEYLEEISKRPESLRRREVLDSARQVFAYLLKQRDRINKKDDKGVQVPEGLEAEP